MINNSNKQTCILGLNLVFHDSAAVLLQDGKIVAAMEEERWFRDDKHTAIFPQRSMTYCIEQAKCKKGDIQHVAINMHPVRCLNNSTSFLDLAFHPTRWSKKKWSNYIIRKKVCNQIEWQVHRTLVNSNIDDKFRFHYVPHHDSHAASAFFVSPYDEAAILTIDANGEWPTLTTSIGKNNKIHRLSTVGLPHSIGGFYASITEHLGFRRNSDEFKVMGLAGYGDPSVYRSIMQHLITTLEGGFFKLNMHYFNYAAYKISPNEQLSKILKCPPRSRNEPITDQHKNIAAALQEHTEFITIRIAKELQKKTRIKNLCLAGGVALNCVMNTAILQQSGFENIFIQPASHDAGSALGAALWVQHQVLNIPRHFVMDRADFGPSFSDAEIELVLKAGMLPYIKSEDIAKDTAYLIGAGNIVGWFQGRAEFGPRALGFRSILADPTNPQMQDHLNLRVKHREDFRPFAPASTVEDYAEYFEGGEDAFMTKICKVREKYKKVLPAITHIDGTARLQTVSSSINPLFHRLIKEFQLIKNFPVIINTSFNVNGEPMVLSPRDALRCFFTTGLDYLVIGSYIVSKFK